MLTDKDEITVEIGTKNIKNTFKIPEDLKAIIKIILREKILSILN